MNLLPVPGIPSAVNAFTVSDDGKIAYFHDPQSDLVYSVNLQTGVRKVLKWEDRSFHHRRWVCYTLFTMKRASGDYLSMLFFNKHKKAFCLIHFQIVDELLIKEQTSVLNTSTISWERLAYTVQKCGNEMQIIFYERFSRTLDAETPPPPLHFVYCLVNCSTMRVTSRAGMLPQGQWELPFVTNGSIHIISSKRTPHLLASMKLTPDSATWDAKAISVVNSEHPPPRKAMWCNSWTRDGGWYSVTEKIEPMGEQTQILRKTSIWNLDPTTSTWTKLNTIFELPDTALNFAFRISGDGTGFIHCDVKTREAAIFKMQLPTALKEVTPKSDDEEWVAEDAIYGDGDGPHEPSTSREPLADLICPICLDTYDDARTLHCGHSMCWECIEKMRIAANSQSVSCPTCRKTTKIPSAGLPVNWGLKDAIATLQNLIELRKNCVRCAGCREKCEEKKMWTCLSCLKEKQPLQRTKPLNRESMMFVGNVDSFDENTEKKDAEEDKEPSLASPQHGDDFLECSYCAGCLLHFHKNHHYEELTHLRTRSKTSREKKRTWLKDAEAKVEEMKNIALDITNQALETVLLSNIETKLDEICNVLENGNDEMEFRGMATMNKLDAIKNEFTQQFGKALQSLIDSCSTPQVSPTMSITSQAAIPTTAMDRPNLIDINTTMPSSECSAASTPRSPEDFKYSATDQPFENSHKEKSQTNDRVWKSSVATADPDALLRAHFVMTNLSPTYENIPPIDDPVKAKLAVIAAPTPYMTKRPSLAEIDHTKHLEKGLSFLESAKSLPTSPLAPPLPMSLPPLENEPFVRRPSVLPIRMAVRNFNYTSPLSSPLTPVTRSSPLVAPSLSQALQFEPKKDQKVRHRPVISEL